MSTARENTVRPPTVKGQCVIGPCVYEDEDGASLPLEDQVAAMLPKIWGQSGDAIDLSGDVSVWTNRGTGGDSVQGNADRRPIFDYALDGRSCTGDHDGIDDFVQFNDQLNGSKLIGVAFKVSDLSIDRCIFGSTTTDGFYAAVRTDGGIQVRGSSGFPQNSVETPVEINKWHVLVVLMNSTPVTYLDGVQLTGINSIGTSNMSNLMLGANRNLDRAFAGCIGEIIVIDSDSGNSTQGNAKIVSDYLTDRHINTLNGILSEALVYLDNNDLNHTGTTYNQWFNKVNSENLQVGNGGSTVIENYNGSTVPAVDTNGSGRLRSTYSGSIDQPCYAVYAGNINVLGGQNVRVLLAAPNSGASANIWYFGKGTDGNHVFVMFNGTLLDNGSSINTAPGVFHAIFKGDATSEGYKNNAQELLGDVGSDTGTASPLRIAHTASNTTLDATFSGVLVVPRIPTDAERIAVNNHFAGKQNTSRIALS